jgi:hypothetical protein
LLPTNVEGWGLGSSGKLFHASKMVAKAKNTFTNEDRVGIWLNMDECILIFFINQVSVLSFRELGWRVFLAQKTIQ